MPSLKEFLLGPKEKVKQATTQTPEMEELMKLLITGLSEGKGQFADIFGPFNEQAFEKGVSQPALKNFQENILPTIQEKFIGQGQTQSSGFNRGLLKAGTDLQSQLAALLYNAQQQQQQNRLQGAQTILGTKPFENIYRPGGEGLVQGVLKGFATGVGQGIGGGATGGVGAIKTPVGATPSQAATIVG